MSNPVLAFEMESHRKGTCDGCGKRRKLYRSTHADAEMRARLKYYSLCVDCCDGDYDAMIEARRVRSAELKAAGPRPRFAYPIIGGPLDGEYAVTTDFRRGLTDREGKVLREGGLYGHLSGEYAEYNSASGGIKRLGARPSMVFIHHSLLKPLARPADR